jgi:hypothetical protein
MLFYISILFSFTLCQFKYYHSIYSNISKQPFQLSMKLKTCLTIAFAFIALASCKKSSVNTKTQTDTTTTTHTTPTASGTDVFVSGNVISSQQFSVATVWKNGKAIALADTTANSYAYSITSSDTDVYISGYANGSPCYWKNGKMVTLPGTYSLGVGIAVSGSDVYVVGYSTTDQNLQVATVWKNGDATLLTSDSPESYAFDIKVIGSDVYVAGSTFKTGGFISVCYWKNGVFTSVSDNSPSGFATPFEGQVALGIAGSDVYLTGSVFNNNGQITATYWKNGNATPLTPNSDPSSSGVNSITISGSTVYMAGFDGYVATYWIGGTAHQLNNGQQQYTATNIAVNSGHVYVAGIAGYSPTSPVYWKDGALVNMVGKNAITTGIAVVQH